MLQNFLIAQNLLAAGNNTGYFGTLTLAAVRRFQCQQNVVCSGTAATTGYGAVGPKTRAAIAKACKAITYAQSAYGGGYAQGNYGSYAQASYGGSYSQGTYYAQGAYAGSYSQGSYYSQANYYSQGSYVTSCTWNGAVVQSGASVTAYQASSVPAGQTCVSQTRTCTNGTLAGTHVYATCSVGGASVMTSKSSYTTTENITTTFGNAPGNKQDWIGIYKQSEPDSGSYAVWLYTDGTQTGTAGITQGSITFSSPNLAAGTYEARLFPNNTRQRLAVSAPFTVEAGQSSTSIATTKSSYVNGDVITAAFTHAPGNKQDWIGIYKQSEPDTGTYAAWFYTDGTTNGTVGITNGSVTFSNLNLAAGTYEARLFPNNTRQRLAVSAPFTVAAFVGCHAPRHYSYSWNSAKPLECGFGSTSIFSVAIPDTGKALARARVSFQHVGSSGVYSWSAFTKVGDGERYLSTGEGGLCAGETNGPRDINGYGTLDDYSRTVTVAGYLDVCGAPISAMSGTLDVWVEDPASECRGKDIGMDYSYPNLNESPFYWSSSMGEIFRINIPATSQPRSKLLVFANTEGNIANAHPSCSRADGVTLLTQLVTDAHGELARHEAPAMTSLGMSHLDLSLFGQTSSLINQSHTLRLLGGSNAGSAFTGGCCGGAMMGFVREQ